MSKEEEAQVAVDFLRAEVMAKDEEYICDTCERETILGEIFVDSENDPCPVCGGDIFTHKKHHERSRRSKSNMICIEGVDDV